VHLRWLLLGACALAGCDSRVDHNKPVGTAVDTDAQIERYVRRAYLDLSGHTPTDADVAAGLQRLRDAGNTAVARGALVDDLLGRDTFSKVWLEELENGIFGGNSLEQQYALVCGIIRGTTPACMSCTNTDSCACSCPQLTPLATERSGLQTAAADFMGGTASSAIERRYATAEAYYALTNGSDARVKALFDDFLGRTAEADEVENGRGMINGSLIAGSPSGLLFHRTGATYADLLDIVFTSEIYREAIVRRVFDRYLARSPSPAELAHFVTTLDATKPDLRGVVRAVLSSREYFAQ